MPRAPSDFPVVPSGVDAAMAMDNRSPLFDFVRKYEPNNVEVQKQFHTDLTLMLHSYVETADRLEADNLRAKIREEHAARLDS